MIIYNGPSMINGKPIVAILTLESANRKTGQMAQLWILPKLSRPLTAIRTGYDEAVCGDCPLRQGQGGACYVNVGHGPSNVWKAFKRGIYPDNTALTPHRYMRRLALRLGAYGDPCAVPFKVIKGLLDICKGGHTGYTHQWRDKRFKPFQSILMASTEDIKSYKEAKRRGWRTFRVVGEYSERQPMERVCPNDSNGVQCVDCKACHGGPGSRADIVIKVHGSWGGRFKREPAYADASG